MLKDNMGEQDCLLAKIFQKKIIWIEQYCILINIFLKDNISSNVLFSTQYFLKRQYALNRIVSWLKFSKKIIWIEPHYLFIKVFLKDNIV